MLRVPSGVTPGRETRRKLCCARSAYGFKASGSVEVADCATSRRPFIVFWQFYHFLVVEGTAQNGAVLNDAGQRPAALRWEEFDRSYTGICLTFAPSPNFTRSNDVPAATSILRSQLTGSWGAVLFVVLAGLALVVPNIALPTFTKTFIDEVMVGKSYGWVYWIAIGIVASIAVQAGLLELQQQAILRLQAKLALANASRMIWHCLRLPMTFFAKRSPPKSPTASQFAIVFPSCSPAGWPRARSA